MTEENLIREFNMGKRVKAICMGIPVVVERDPDDTDEVIFHGRLAWLAMLLPWNEAVMLYHDEDRYLSGLWYWLRWNPDEE